jgi:penicillin-binding protein 2
MPRNSRLKDHGAEQRLFGRRVVAASFVIMLLLGALGSRLFFLQVLKHDYFAELSQGNRIRIDPLPPPRGLILDRNGVALAVNRPAYQLELTREQTPDVDDTLRRLVALGLLAQEDLDRTRKLIMSRRTFDEVPIKLQLTEEELARFAVHRPDFPGVEIRPRLTRYYPKDGLGVHALGYVAAISEADQKRIDESAYAGTTLIGKQGLERNYEELLHGTTGYQQLLVNAQGRRVERVGAKAPTLVRKEPVAGDDLITSIDERLQEIAEQALGTQRGAVVAIDPSNGNILAFVSTPTFDPNAFARGLTVAEYRSLQDDIDKPLYDRALRGVYPPGSTIKPFVALAGLEYGVADPKAVRYCRGVWQFPGSSHRYRDWKKNGHGPVNMRTAIAQSCDVYFYGVADQIGIDRLHDFLVRFGMGNKIGIDIQGELKGLVPSPAWKKQAFKNKALQVWFPGETVIAGIGQGYLLVTPLQLAHATATIAARGRRFEPRFVTGVRDPVTGKVTSIPPRPLPEVQVKDPKDWDVIIDGMVAVTSPGGTAYRAQAGAPYQMAGKTGTAQVFSIGQNEKYNEKQLTDRLFDHALFISFAPAGAPRLAIAVLVENGKHGASAAAPIARKLFDAYLLPASAATATTPSAAPAPEGPDE